MANSWLRLWHDFPDDPKWRTIARIAHEPISTVQAVYLRLMVSASQAEPRGEARINPVVTADALDIEAESVIRIIEAMQGLVMDGDRLTGWERRQRAQEDSSAERTKRWRERKNGDAVTPSRDVSRDDLSVSVTKRKPAYSPF